MCVFFFFFCFFVFRWLEGFVSKRLFSVNSTRKIFLCPGFLDSLWFHETTKEICKETDLNVWRVKLVRSSLFRAHSRPRIRVSLVEFTDDAVSERRFGGMCRMIRNSRSEGIVSFRRWNFLCGLAEIRSVKALPFPFHGFTC